MTAQQTIKKVEIEENEGQTTVTLNGTKIEIGSESNVTVYTNQGVRAKLLDENEEPETGFRTDFNSVAVKGAVIEVSPDATFTVTAKTLQVKQPSTDEAPLIGHQMKDGTVYAGDSPDTGKAMFVAPADAVATIDQAEKTAKNGGGRLPSPAELHVILSNSDRGALAGTFNQEGHLAYYLSSQRKGRDAVIAERASTGKQQPIGRANDASVRFIVR